MLHEIVNTLSVGVVVLDAREGVCVWNDWMVQRSRCSREQVIGSRLQEVFPELNGSRIELALRQALRTGLPSVLSHSLNRTPLPLFPPDTEKRRLDQSVVVRPIDSGADRFCMIEVTDVSAATERERLLKNQALTLSWQATHDALTGLGNRIMLMQLLEQACGPFLARKEDCALLLFDLDGFKPINDTYGHQVGDEMLKHVSHVLSHSLRGSDYAVRVGGDEFAVILFGCALQRALDIAHALVAQLQRVPLSWQEQDLFVSASVGVTAIANSGARTPQMALERADQAMYAAKREGKSRACVWEEGLERWS